MAWIRTISSLFVVFDYLGSRIQSDTDASLMPLEFYSGRGVSTDCINVPRFTKIQPARLSLIYFGSPSESSHYLHFKFPW